jgi:hypothetical protein
MNTHFFAPCFILGIWYNNSVRKKRKKIMNKKVNLTKEQKDKILAKTQKGIVGLVIAYVEKYGDEKNTLEENVDVAWDMIQQHAE